MKNGFTLMEVLLVITIASIVGVSSVVMYETTTNVTKEEKLKNTYVDIQKAASLYMDIDSNALESFRENKYLNVPLSTLESNNYVEDELKNPVDNSDIPSDYVVRMYIASYNSKNYLDSCIIKRNGEKPICISNSKGEPCGCCGFEINDNNKSCK